MNSAVLAAKMKIGQSKTSAPPAKKAFDFDSFASLAEDPSKAPWVLALATSLLLAPFLTRAFNIDEPLFLWAAAQIQSHPGDPYGFNVNWDNTAEPMWGVTEGDRTSRGIPVACRSGGARTLFSRGKNVPATGFGGSDDAGCAGVPSVKRDSDVRCDDAGVLALVNLLLDEGA